MKLVARKGHLGNPHVPINPIAHAGSTQEIVDPDRHARTIRPQVIGHGCLSEQLLLKDGAGAIAAIAPRAPLGKIR